MKRLSILLITSLFLLLQGSSTLASDWTPIVKKLEGSVVKLEHAEGLCSGFIINKEKGYVLTASHCNGFELFADGKPAIIVYRDRVLDLMILQIPDNTRPALTISLNDPIIGEDVIAYGYGYGLRKPISRTMSIADVDVIIPEGVDDLFVMTSSSFIPGQSGGPVVNTEGEVVMIVQMGNQAVGIGRGAKLIRKKIKRFLPE